MRNATPYDLEVGLRHNRILNEWVGVSELLVRRTVNNGLTDSPP